MGEKKFWQKTWFIMLMFILVPPLGTALVWLCKKDWHKYLKIGLSAVLCLWTLIWGIALFSPTDKNDESPATEESVTEHTVQASAITTAPAQTTEKEKESTAQQTTERETTAENTTEKKEAAVAKPSATQKETTTAKPTATKKVTTTVDPESKVTVYITATGKRYHHENPCGNGTYYAATLAQAKSRGLTPCQKCVLH